MCYFVATGSDTMGPHNIDRSVAEDGFRQVSDASGSGLLITPKPWTQGDQLTQSSELLDNDHIAYANVFELIAPLRDAMMYDPASLTADRWAELSKSLVDCNIKENDTTMQKNGQDMTVYSVANVYTLLQAAGGQDTHHPILQFLEEGAIELVCLAVPSLVMDHCEEVRTANGVTTEPSTCWHQAYAELYGSDPRVEGAAQAVTTAGDATTDADADVNATQAVTTAGDATTDADTDINATQAVTTAGDATTDADADINAGTGHGLPAWLGLCVGALLTPWL
jgi:hypothetical protein